MDSKPNCVGPLHVQQPPSGYKADTNTSIHALNWATYVIQRPIESLFSNENNNTQVFASNLYVTKTHKAFSQSCVSKDKEKDFCNDKKHKLKNWAQIDADNFEQAMPW